MKGTRTPAATGSTFGSWGDSLWWALTTVGYGDHVPVTAARPLVATW